MRATWPNRASCTTRTPARDERPVRLGRKNIRLLLDTEAADDVVTLPLARIMRDGSGHFVFDPNFIPPVHPDQRQRSG